MYLGDVIKVEKNEIFPADILILETSDKKNICMIETKNLDGETNLNYKWVNFEMLEM